MSEFFTFTLPNGIRCIHKRVKSQVVHCAMTINAGSRDELKGEYGMAHLVEHTIFKGTEHRKAYQINCRLEQLGGELNAYTTKEDTVVQTTSLRGDFAKSVDLIADLVFHSTFPAKGVDNEKEVIFDEINLYKDTPSERIFDDFEDLIFEGSSLGHNILGSKSTLRSLSTTEIKGFINRTYNTDQMVFSSIGNITERRFSEVVTRYLCDVNESKRAFERTAPTIVPPFTKVINRSTHQTHCIVGNRAYSLSEDKRVALVLLTNLLGGPSANSLLGVLLREKNALSYSTEASYTPLTDSGIFEIYYSSEHDKADQCAQLVAELLERLRREPVSQRTLAMAKRQFIGQFAVASESNENYMLGVGKSFLVFNEVDSQNEINEQINSITADEIMEAANDVFSNMSTLIFK